MPRRSRSPRTRRRTWASHRTLGADEDPQAGPRARRSQPARPGWPNPRRTPTGSSTSPRSRVGGTPAASEAPRGTGRSDAEPRGAPSPIGIRETEERAFDRRIVLAAGDDLNAVLVEDGQNSTERHAVGQKERDVPPIVITRDLRRGEPGESLACRADHRGRAPVAQLKLERTRSGPAHQLSHASGEADEPMVDERDPVGETSNLVHPLGGP